RNLTNPNPYTWSMRALLVAMQNWVKDGQEPPPSQYPMLAEGKLVAVSALHFPKIPGITVPRRLQKGYRADYGPEFRTRGIAAIEPPKIGKAFPALVPQVDADGTDTAGIRMPDIQAPLATFTGWNLRAPELGAPDELVSGQGSYIPFARTRAERAKNKDPRLSVEERYKDREDYLAKVEAAARSLAAGGYLLEQDIPKLIERGSAEWDLH
ncbi:MAG: alpha/beta hydrolase domain-containing protein, partial [Bryobacteraceae bacterium]